MGLRVRLLVATLVTYICSAGLFWALADLMPPGIILGMKMDSNMTQREPRVDVTSGRLVGNAASRVRLVTAKPPTESKSRDTTHPEEIPQTYKSAVANCQSNAEAKKKSFWFDKIISTTVPVFLNRANKTITRTARRWWMANMGQRDAPLDEIIAQLLAVVPGKGSFHKDDKTCISCAIVGNAGNLLGSGYGSLIDSQDVIIRSNRSPLEGFEEDVGSRTTHQILYPESGDFYHRGASVILLPFKPNDLKWLTTLFSTKDTLIKGFWKQVVQILPEAKSEDAYIIHPEFIHYVQTELLSNKERRKWPSAGIVALFLSLHLCDQIHAMGFGISKTGRWDHYYDAQAHRIAKPAKVISHPVDLEAAARNQMRVDNLIKLYPGN